MSYFKWLKWLVKNLFRKFKVLNCWTQMNFTINQFYLFCLTNMIEVLNAFKFQFM